MKTQINNINELGTQVGKLDNAEYRKVFVEGIELPSTTNKTIFNIEENEVASIVSSGYQ